MEYTNWDLFFDQISRLVHEFESRTQNNLLDLKVRLEMAIDGITNLNSLITTTSITDLLCQFRIFSQILHREINGILNNLAIFSYATEFEKVEGPGRPRYILSEDILVDLRDLGFNWNEIFSMLLVSCWTVYRRVQKLSISDVTGYSTISDQELKRIIEDFKVQHEPTTGRSMTLGHIKSIGIRAQQQRLAKALAKVDPINSQIRWASLIRRRKYKVPGPNSLWHCDGHHSLLHWGFVIHGGIDGFS